MWWVTSVVPGASWPRLWRRASPLAGLGIVGRVVPRVWSGGQRSDRQGDCQGMVTISPSPVRHPVGLGECRIGWRHSVGGRRTSLLQAGADLLLGATCPGCGEPWPRLCSDCAAMLVEYPAQPHHKAAVGELPLWATLPFDGLASVLISAAKDRHRWDLVPILGDCLARALAGLVDAVGPRAGPGSALSGAGPLWLVPIPSAGSAVRRRGLDVGVRLARAARWRLGQAGVAAEVCPLLRPVRRVADQSGLGPMERLDNLAGAYGLAPGWPEADRWGPVVLVDDVVTTGASLGEGWRVLRAAGGTVVGAATVAATEDRD